MCKNLRGILLIPCIIGLLLGSNRVFAQPPGIQPSEITIGTLSKWPEVYVDREIVVRGKLIVIGDYYASDSKFVIVDEKGNRFPVTTWRPITIAPTLLPGGGVRPVDEKRLMHYYLNKNLLIRGKVMAKRGKIMLHIEGEHYLEVKDAEEIE